MIIHKNDWEMIFSGKKLGPIFLQSFTSTPIAQPPGTSCEKKADKKKSFFFLHNKIFQNILYRCGHILLRSIVLISRYILDNHNFDHLPSLILAAMTRMRIMMMRQLTRVIFLRLFSVWDTHGLLASSSPEITPSTSGAEDCAGSEMRRIIFSWSGFFN